MAVIPDTNVNLATNIRDVLNAAGGSVSNDVTSFFKSAAKIKIWAKFKPVVSPVLFYTLEEWKSYGYKGASHTCGFVIPTFQTISSFYQSVVDGKASWTYQLPTGGTTSPYRLGDFRGYNTEASHPVGDIYTNGLIDANGYATFSIDAIVEDEYSLGLKDFDLGNDVPFTSFYLGILAWSGSSYKYITNTSPVGSDGANFTVSLQLNTVGTWTFAPFLCSSPQTGNETLGTYLLLGTEGSFGSKTVYFISSSSTKNHTATAVWNEGRTKITLVGIAFDNLTNSSVTFSNIKVFFRTGDKPAEGSNIGQYNYSGSITVPANTRGYIVETSYSLAATHSQNTAYWVGVSSNQTDDAVDVWNGIDELSDEA